MKYIITKGISCGLTIPNGKSFVIDNFTFLPDFEGEYQTRHIQTVVEANTQEEAKKKAKKMFSDFLAKLTLMDNSKYILENEFSANMLGSSTTTHAHTISAKASIAQNANNVKKSYEKHYDKSIRKKPMRLYRDAINSDNLFDKYRDFYRVIECYGNAPGWIQSHIEKPIMKQYKFKGKTSKTTILSWLRHRISHSRHKEGVEPLLESNPQHIYLVQKYLPKIQELARKKIKEEEGKTCKTEVYGKEES